MRTDFTPIRFMNPTPQDAANAQAIADSEARRNEILTERLELQRQLSKFETDITSKINKRIQLEATLAENVNATKDLEKQILKNKEAQAIIDTRIKGVTDDRTKQAAKLISQLKKQIESTTDIGRQEALYNRLRKLSNVEGAYQLSILQDQLNTLQEENQELNDILDTSKQLDRSFFGITGKMASIVPGMGKFSQAFQAAAVASRAAGGGMKGLQAGFAAMYKLALPAMFAALAIEANKADKQIIALNRSLVITRGEAFLIREQFVEQSRAIYDTAITTDKLLDAQSKLSDALGITKIFSQGINQEFINLTQKVKISEEAAVGLSKITLATGKNARQITVNTVGAIEKVKQETKLRLDNRKILEQTGKVSGQLLANFKANPAAIAEAIAKTQALGTTLEQTKAQAESLLNFETSIENELKAELITGKQINLERARMAALMGDQKTVAEELSKQAVDFNTFSEMNVIAQKSLAEALGTSADALSDQLFKQQYLNKSREEILAIGGKEALERMEQLTAQEKFNNAVDKLKDLLGNLVAGPLGLMLSLLSDALQIVTLIGAPFRLIGDMINKLLGPANSFGTILKGVLFTVIGIMTFISPIKALLSLAALGGVILGVEALMGKSKKQEEFADGGIVLSEINNATVGEAGPEAIIPLNSPKADKMLNGGSSIDLTPMIAAINEVKAAVNNLASRPAVAYIQGKDAFSKEVSTTSVQNTYKFA